MKSTWKSLLVKVMLPATFLLGGSALFAQPRFSVGIGIGAPGYYAPGPVGYRPAIPGPGYTWVDGYYGAYGAWTPGYWALPPYSGAYWVGPRYFGGRYYGGYWGGPRYGYRGGPAFREGFRGGGFRGGYGHYGRR